ncbi:MAG: heme-binding protein [Gammaproteobacteria bacterium]|nr:MAG: heme-binding protein [Gammaproteobacteria bacterium]
MKALKRTLIASLLSGLSITSLNLMAADAPAKPDVNPANNQRPQVPTAKGPSLELAVEAARVAIETCAADGGQKIAVSVVDSAGILKLLLAADGASPRGVASSTNKAITALNFKTTSSNVGEQAKTDKTLADKIAADTTINARPGGVLLKVGDEIIGAIGVGGGKTDEPCALKGIEKIQSRLKAI